MMVGHLIISREMLKKISQKGIQLYFQSLLNVKDQQVRTADKTCAYASEHNTFIIASLRQIRVKN